MKTKKCRQYQKKCKQQIKQPYDHTFSEGMTSQNSQKL